MNFALLAASFQRVQGGIRGFGLLTQALKVFAASAVMGIACFGVWQVCEKLFGSGGFGPTLVSALAPIIAGATVYLAAGQWLRIAEVVDLTGWAKRRLLRGSPP